MYYYKYYINSEEYILQRKYKDWEVEFRVISRKSALLIF